MVEYVEMSEMTLKKRGLVLSGDGAGWLSVWRVDMGKPMEVCQREREDDCPLEKANWSTQGTLKAEEKV
jgi:hypothetical protein